MARVDTSFGAFTVATKLPVMGSRIPYWQPHLPVHHRSRQKHIDGPSIIAKSGVVRLRKRVNQNSARR
jgi:hypothetical protein